MDKICLYALISKNHPNGIIQSTKREFNTLFEPFPSLGTKLPFVYQWDIPAWLRFEQDIIWDLKQIDCITPTASQMLVDVILFHRNQNIDIYVSNLKSDLFFATYNDIKICTFS